MPNYKLQERLDELGYKTIGSVVSPHYLPPKGIINRKDPVFPGFAGYIINSAKLGGENDSQYSLFSIPLTPEELSKTVFEFNEGEKYFDRFAGDCEKGKDLLHKAIELSFKQTSTLREGGSEPIIRQNFPKHEVFSAYLSAASAFYNEGNERSTLKALEKAQSLIVGCVDHTTVAECLRDPHNADHLKQIIEENNSLSYIAQALQIPTHQNYQWISETFGDPIQFIEQNESNVKILEQIPHDGCGILISVRPPGLGPAGYTFSRIPVVPQQLASKIDTLTLEEKKQNKKLDEVAA